MQGGVGEILMCEVQQGVHLHALMKGTFHVRTGSSDEPLHLLLLVLCDPLSDIDTACPTYSGAESRLLHSYHPISISFRIRIRIEMPRS